MGRKHVLVVPVPMHAHYAGIYRLSLHLAQRGVTVTMVGVPEEFARLRTLGEVQELDFNMIPYKEIEATGNHPLSTFITSGRELFRPILDKLMDDQKAGLPGPTCMIGDRFFHCAKDIAEELNIPYYQFFSCGAVYARELQAMFDLFADGTLTMTGKTGAMSLAEFEGPLEIPGLPALRWREMTRSKIGAEWFNGIGGNVGDADAVIVNTFYELEAPQIDAIRQRWIEDPRGKTHHLFLVGPLSNAATFKDRMFAADLDDRGATFLEWLDKQPPQSVIYVSLGTLIKFDLSKTKELGLAIEASEQRFLWVIHRGGEAALPPDFVERTRDKGLVVTGWVPQLQILAHTSIGGFLTHCGWNSIMESISSGVSMAAWPQMPIDQFINCRHLVNVLKVAVEINSSFTGEAAPEASPLTAREVIREEIVRVMRLLLSEEGEALRSRAQVLKELAQAVADGGVSQKALNDLVDFIPSWQESSVPSNLTSARASAPVFNTATEANSPSSLVGISHTQRRSS